MSTLPQQVEQSIRMRGLFQRGRKILVAVSGGVDSMVLLDVLHKLSATNRWRLTVAHLNHQLRGRSSDADERLVVRTAKALGLGIVVERADVRKQAATGGVSVEMAAREARHGFLGRTAARLKIHSVALAHHADDQVELFFLRLLRGTGSEGLAGMRWKSPSPIPNKSGINVVRPLLDQPKEMLREYAAARNIAFREDASNASQDILRNRIRHELIPLLRQKYQPAVKRVVLRLMELASADADVTDKAASRWLASKIQGPNSRIQSQRSDEFEKLPVAVQRRVIQLELRSKNIASDFALVERLRTHLDQPVTVAPGTVVLRDKVAGLVLRVGTRSSNRVENPATGGREKRLQINGRAGKSIFDGRRFQWQVTIQKRFRRPRPQPDTEVFDADEVGSQVVVRHWQPGDRFQPIGMAESVKLQNFFTNQHVPRHRRHELLLATTVEGNVFWVEGMRISERFKLTPNTRRCLVWRWKAG